MLLPKDGTFWIYHSQSRVRTAAAARILPRSALASAQCSYLFKCTRNRFRMFQPFVDLDVRLNKADDRRLSHPGARTGPARHAQSRRQFLTWQVCLRLLLTGLVCSLYCLPCLTLLL